MRGLVLLALLLPSAVAQDGPDLVWEWTPGSPWLAGVPVNEEAFGGGLGFGADFVFSTVPDREVPPVRVVFDASLETAAAVFDWGNGLRYLGAGRFPGAAYDISDPDRPRRLNVGFFEDQRSKPSDLIWNPDGSADGAREYLVVFDSDYDGDGTTYAGETGYSLDTVYGLAARVADGRQLLESRAELAVRPAPLRDVDATAVDDGVALVRWTEAAHLGGDVVRVTADGALLAEAPSEDGEIRAEGLDPDRVYDLRIELFDADANGLGYRTARVRPRATLGVAAASSLDPGRAGASTYGDIWGYTAPDGTEYALLAGRGTGLSVIDITAAPGAQPVEVAFVASPEGARDAKDVKVYGRYAYVVHEVGPLQIVDLGTPEAAAEVGRLDVQPGVANGGAHNVLVARDHLWVTGGRTAGNAGVRVYSLADPTAPQFVGGFSPTHQDVPYYHDFEVRGDRGYGPAIYSGGGVDVLDVSDPADIRLVTTFTYPGAGAHNTCSTEDGQTLYVGDEIGTSGQWTRIFDVSDLADVERVGDIVVDEQAAVHNCYVRGDRLYIAHYTEGMRVFDVSEPHAPVEVAFYDTYRLPGYGFRGAWTAYPFFESGKVIVSDLQSGLFVVTLADGVATLVAAPPANLGPLRVWPNPSAGRATVAFDLVAPATARVALYDVLGREVAVAADGPRGAGEHRVALDVSALPTGLYLARLSLDGKTAASAPITVAR